MRLAPLIALALVATPLAARAEPGSDREPPSITVSGQGLVSVAPDRAVVTSGVVTRAASAAAALKANAAAMNKVMTALKAQKVEDRDVSTSGLSVQPQYDYGDGQNQGPRTPKLVGYEARNAVAVRTRDLAGLGELIDALVAAGSNQIDGLEFVVSDKGAKLDEARKSAITEARRKAELYAAGAGVRLGAPLSIEEQELGGAPQPQMFAARAKSMDAVAASPVSPGEQELGVRVTASWELLK